MSAPTRNESRREAGFTLVEMLVVVGIIMIMAAVATPQISRYIRNYRIRGASQAVASELTSARTKAIMKNVNLGVVFYADSATTYRWVIEDNQAAPAARLMAGGVSDLNTIVTTPALATEQAGSLHVLPERVRFGGTCPGFAANRRGLRFNRLGSWCDLGPPACPDINTGANLLWFNAANGTVNVCLEEIDTNLTRLLTINASGRVVEPQ